VNWLKFTSTTTLSNDDFETIKRKTISVYPNPITENTLTVKGLKNIEEFEIYDLHGKAIKSNLLLDRSTNTIDVSDLQSGVYFIRITSNGSEEVIKIIKR